MLVSGSGCRVESLRQTEARVGHRLGSGVEDFGLTEVISDHLGAATRRAEPGEEAKVVNLLGEDGVILHIHTPCS